MTALDAMAVDHVIRDAQRFKDLLDSPVIGVVLRLTEQQHYQEFLKAKTPEEMTSAQAKARVLEDVMHNLRVVLSAGERDAIERERRERQAAADRPNHEG